MSEIDDTALEWVARQSARALDGPEQAAFAAWHEAHPRHPGAYLRALAIQHSLDQVTLQETQRAAPPHRESANEAAGQPASAPRRQWLVGGALAAGLAALGVMALRPQAAARSVFVTAKGEFRKVPLVDSSVISINSASQVEVAMSASERRIVLTRGEAWFEVAKDKSKPFVVEAGDVRVRAVGTAFAVRRHPNGAEVVVTEGVVEVWSESGTVRRQMGVGTHAFVGEGAGAIAVTRDAGEVERLLAWREGKLVFQHRTLAEAVADFNRYNTRQLVIADPALRRKTLVGRYRIDQPEEFAKDVHLLMKVPVALEAEQIRIGAALARN